jgi:hypothetical protein
MDLLTFIGQAAKRRDDYVDRAQRLAESHPSLEKLEEEMRSRADALTRKLKASKITLSEFQRASAEDTLVSSLAAYMLGQNKTEIGGTIFQETMGQMKYLWNFFDDIKLSIDNDRLSDFAEDDDDDWYYPVPGADQPLPVSGRDVDVQAPVVSTPASLSIPVSGMGAIDAAVKAVNASADELSSQTKSVKISPTAATETQAQQAESGAKPINRQRGPASWNGVESRLKRFLETPLYRWYNVGEFSKNQELGYREMQRVSKLDKRVCRDCVYYDSLGWVPIGSLPMPGVGCRCHDRCRCRIVYR